MESMQYFWRKIGEDYNFVRLLIAHSRPHVVYGGAESSKFKPPICYQSWDEYWRDCRPLPFGPWHIRRATFYAIGSSRKANRWGCGVTVGTY
jgi:hypothetical protein